MGSTKGVLLMPAMRQLVINDTACPDVSMSKGNMLDLEQPLLCVEGVQHLVLFILGLTLTKCFEELAITRQSM